MKYSSVFGLFLGNTVYVTIPYMNFIRPPVLSFSNWTRFFLHVAWIWMSARSIHIYTKTGTILRIEQHKHRIALKYHTVQIPESFLCSIFGFELSKRRPFPFKRGVIWVPGTLWHKRITIANIYISEISARVWTLSPRKNHQKSDLGGEKCHFWGVKTSSLPQKLRSAGPSLSVVWPRWTLPRARWFWGVWGVWWFGFRWHPRKWIRDSDTNRGIPTKPPGPKPPVLTSSWWMKHIWKTYLRWHPGSWNISHTGNRIHCYGQTKFLATNGREIIVENCQICVTCSG